jgi:hypothetical protein
MDDRATTSFERFVFTITGQLIDFKTAGETRPDFQP